MTLLKDLISIPERVHKGDFVLRLTEGIADREGTLRDYVVTEQLVRCFDQALSLIRSAVSTGSSKGAYLHGSFGSGKSHFMAVLHLLLQHDPSARKVPELAPVVATHSAWMTDKKFLLVPYHMINAGSMESALFDGYVSTVRALHPDAPLPAVYRSEPIFADARAIRARMGDVPFFAMLNAGGKPRAESDSKPRWGKMPGVWDAKRFEEAMAADHGTRVRKSLEQDLVGRIFTSYGEVAGQDAYIDIDPGLAELSQHAHSLGYQGLVLFLDELILWLASRVADMSFISREVQKVPKLVESRSSDRRPCPIISFVARQRDLRELVGEHVPGAEALGFTDLLNYWKDRFDTITLEDRNLPAIVERRLLRPRDSSAKAAIDEAFRQTEKTREEVLNVLLTREGDRKMFRAVYPFSPALVSVLVAVSSALQRERTALRVMLQLLVDQRDHLALGQVIPVGDLFDVIAEGDQPFSEAMRKQYDDAKKLYWNKIVPMLVDQHQLGRYENLEQLPPDDPKARAFRADDRLLKTLLLSALVPDEESLKALNCERLQALNHGSIRTPIQGREAPEVLRRVRRWASLVGEIKVGDAENPVLTVQLTGVDVEHILERAAHIDNRQERLRKIRTVLFEQLGVQPGDMFGTSYEWIWRGTKRSVEVVFGNIREHADETLRAPPFGWKVFLDYPFDEPGFSPLHDLQKIDAYLANNNASTQTVCWVPAFFSRETLRDLKTLVILDHVLAGERLNDFGDHLNQTERQQARVLLDNQRSQLQQKLIEVLGMAYGIATPQPRVLDQDLDAGDQLKSLDPAFAPKPPVGNNLKKAFEKLLDQMLEHQYPAHPEFEREIKVGDLRKVLEVVEAAASDPGRRTVPEKPVRALMQQIAMPLGLGEQHDAPFLLKDTWKDRFLRAGAKAEGPLTVARLREAIDEPRPMGLPVAVQNLLILAFAAQTGKRFVGDASGRESLDQLDDSLELRDQRLPEEKPWEIARDRASRLFGQVVSALRNAHNVAELERKLEEQGALLRGDAEKLPRALRERLAQLGLRDDIPRLATADDALALLGSMRNHKDGAVLALASFELKVPADAVARSLKSAGPVRVVLDGSQWQLIDGLRQVDDERGPEATEIVAELADALADDEYVTPLAASAERSFAQAIALLARSTTQKPEPPRARGARTETARVVSNGSLRGASPDEGRRCLADLKAQLDGPNRTLDIQWVVREKSVGDEG